MSSAGLGDSQQAVLFFGFGCTSVVTRPLPGICISPLVRTPVLGLGPAYLGWLVSTDHIPVRLQAGVLGDELGLGDAEGCRAVGPAFP